MSGGKSQFCPICETTRNVELVRGTIAFEIRGERIEVDSEHFRCTSCGEDFETTRSFDSLAAAYEAYRTKHGMLSPDEIRTWRKSYNLTQRELAKLLGWGEVTVARYETGSLQSESHEKVLRLVMDPANLRKLVQQAPNSVKSAKRTKLLNVLRNLDLGDGLSDVAASREKLFSYCADKFSGFKTLEWDKIVDCVSLLCVTPQPKTKLTKLLFYVDFLHFKKHSVSITGCRYARLPLGPVPNEYKILLAELQAQTVVVCDEQEKGDYTAEMYRRVEQVEPSNLSKEERNTVEYVRNYFDQYSAKEIAEYSHLEPSYVHTEECELIPYSHAATLRIPDNCEP